MTASSWNFSAGKLPKAPYGLIIGIKNGVSIPAGWYVWGNANNYFLRGTTSDGLIGASALQTVSQVQSGGGGSHSWTSGSREVAGTGIKASGSSYLKSPSNDSTWEPQNNVNKGDHSGHYVTIYYTPPACSLKLIQAGVSGALFFNGAVVFSLTDNPNQTVFSAFTNNPSGYLKAGASTTFEPPINNHNSATSEVSDYHIHTKNEYRPAWSAGLTGLPTSVGYGGGGHAHATGVYSIAPNLKSIYLKVYEIIDKIKLDGIIGLWPFPGAPPVGWEVVAEANDNYIRFSNSITTGVSSGNNTISISGETGWNGHSHSYSGSGNDISSAQAHPNTVSHNHGYSDAAKAYNPNYFYVKLLKYVG